MQTKGIFFNMMYLQLLLLSSTINFLRAAYCSGKPEPGERINSIPIHDELKPRLIRSVSNAMLFEAGPLNATFPIVHIWGNPYEIGALYV